MNKTKVERRIARGAARWHAPRLKNEVKNNGIKNKRKMKK
jgi:hypothetical protein